MLTGTVFLIPVTLGGEEFAKVIPEGVLHLTKGLRFFIVEDIRSARRFLRMIDKTFPIDDSIFYELNEHIIDSDIAHYLEPLKEGFDIGLMSEAGMPGIADPGARIIGMAHRKGYKVSPLSGPSSILMALVSSGLNGQQFTFNGYLPIKPADRLLRLRELEKRCAEGYAQIFMETPYRAEKLLLAIVTSCNSDLRLCIAADITLPNQFIRTKKISEWRKELPHLNNRLVVFVLQ